MANPEHLEILKQGVDFWNKWRAENPNIRPDLRNATLVLRYLTETNGSGRNNGKLSRSGVFYIDMPLHRIDFREADLSGSDLTGAILTEANLARANLISANLCETHLVFAKLREANLSGANLFRADMWGANLYRTSLNGVDLREADIIQVDLHEVDLNGANLREAQMANCSLINVDLSVTKGINRVIHLGPSSIDIATIYRSEGNIPESFLRGAGVPDNFIEYMSSLTSKALDFYSCFISYSSQDQEFAELLYADLQKRGVRCWFAPEDMKIGDKIRQRIDQSIRIHDKLLLILSKNSINSEWVEDECEVAYEEERKRKKTVLFPVRIDDAVIDTDQAWAAKLKRSRHIGDFTLWKDHDAYQKSFERLLRDLKAEG
jgi:uncharacterized protein YjbI with pentapeptide repeats